MAKRRQVKSKPCHGTPPACTAGELSPAVWSILALTYHKILFNKRKIATIEWVSTHTYTHTHIHTHTHTHIHTHTHSKYADLYNMLSIHICYHICYSYSIQICYLFILMVYAYDFDWLDYGQWNKVLKAQRWYTSFLRVGNRYCSFLYLYHFTLFWVLCKKYF